MGILFYQRLIDCRISGQGVIFGACVILLGRNILDVLACMSCGSFLRGTIRAVPNPLRIRFAATTTCGRELPVAIPANARFLKGFLRPQPGRIHPADRVIHAIVVNIAIAPAVVGRIGRGKTPHGGIIIPVAKADKAGIAIDQAPGKTDGQREFGQGVVAQVAEAVPGESLDDAITVREDFGRAHLITAAGQREAGCKRASSPSLVSAETQAAGRT